MRKVVLELQVSVVVLMNEDIPVSQVVDELDYGFNDTTTSANVVDTGILDYDVVDSK